MTPAINPLFWLTLLMRWMHIGSAIILIGAVVFMRFFLLPAAAKLDAETRQALWDRINKPWRMVLGLVILTQIGSGVYWLLAVVDFSAQPAIYRLFFTLKMLAALAFFFLLSVLAGRAPAFEKFRQENKTWLTVCVTLGAFIIACAAAMHLIR